MGLRRPHGTPHGITADYWKVVRLEYCAPGVSVGPRAPGATWNPDAPVATGTLGLFVDRRTARTTRALCLRNLTINVDPQSAENLVAQIYTQARTADPFWADATDVLE